MNKKFMTYQLATLSFIVIITFSYITIQAYSIQQTAGGNIVTIRPGETKSITWGLLNDRLNQTLKMDIAVKGNGSEFVSMPKSVDLIPRELTSIEGTVSIPPNFTSSATLSATLTATRSNMADATTWADENGGSLAQIKIVPTKILTILVQ